MDTEYTRDLARKLGREILEFQNSLSALRRQIPKLSGAWNSPAANDYIREANALIKALEVDIDRLEELRRLLNFEIDQWIQADTDGGSTSPGQFAVSIGGGVRTDLRFHIDDYELFLYGGLGIAGGITAGYNYETIWGVMHSSFGIGGSTAHPFDWGAWRGDMFNHAINYGENVVGTGLRNAPYEKYKDVGRFINQHWHKSARGGAVGQWDKIGHIAKSPAMQKWGIPFVGDTVSGLVEGESVQQAVLSGGISASIKYLIPGVGTAVMVSDGVQLVGDLASGILKFTGNEETAAWLQDTMDYVDLGGYVEGISDGIADFVLNPETRTETFEGLQHIGETISDFDCGIEVDVDFSFGSSFSLDV